MWFFEDVSNNLLLQNMKKLLMFALALVFTASVYAAEFPTITIPDLKTTISSKNVVLLDVNGTDSWQSGHIPGALDFVAVQDHLASVLPKDKQALIVAYCGNPSCPAYRASANAAKKLGYKNVKHLSAGIMGWKDAGEKTEKGS
jgi:rhodanese-related sulfurtransferase